MQKHSEVLLSHRPLDGGAYGRTRRNGRSVMQADRQIYVPPVVPKLAAENGGASTEPLASFEKP
jgi:hypothetical protein